MKIAIVLFFIFSPFEVYGLQWILSSKAFSVLYHLFSFEFLFVSLPPPFYAFNLLVLFNQPDA